MNDSYEPTDEEIDIVDNVVRYIWRDGYKTGYAKGVKEEEQRHQRGFFSRMTDYVGTLLFGTVMGTFGSLILLKLLGVLVLP